MSPPKEKAHASPPRRWWKEATVYQIWPRSFKDTKGTGHGDLRGIVSKLDYLKNLGVDVLWLSPIYASPGKDMGYDISDYRAINPDFGTMDDVDELIGCLHGRGMKLVMDLVVNHTSDQHDWFKESRSSNMNPKRDWYIWRDPKYDAEGCRQPPNNWGSVFGGSAWEYDEATQQYYMHIFTTEQPDLNWDNPEVRKTIHDMMKFWLDKKVDGFRMDVINVISKTPGFPDAPVLIPGKSYQPAEDLFTNGPRLHEFLKELRSEVLSHYDIMSIGEMPWLKDPNEALKVVGSDRKELDMLFQFDLVCIDFGVDGRFTSPKVHWDLPQMKRIVGDWQTFMIANDGWNSLFIENHDQPRSISRFLDRNVTDNDDQLRSLAAKMLATFQFGQCGTLFIYQGEEIGMRNLPTNWPIEEYKDIETLNRYNEMLEETKSDPVLIEKFMKEVHLKARDNARTPVQWDESPNAGFTTATPWMRVNEDYSRWNAASQTNDHDSVFGFWKRLIKLRSQYADLFIYGDFEMLQPDDKETMVYRRRCVNHEALVLLNFIAGDVSWRPPAEKTGLANLILTDNILICNYPGGYVSDGNVNLRPYEAVVFYRGVGLCKGAVSAFNTQLS